MPATIKKETQAQVFSCEFCEIFNNTFFTKHLCHLKVIAIDTLTYFWPRFQFYNPWNLFGVFRECKMGILTRNGFIILICNQTILIFCSYRFTHGKIHLKKETSYFSWNCYYHCFSFHLDEVFDCCFVSRFRKV